MAQGDSQGQSVMVQGRIVWTSGNLFTGKAQVDQMTKQPRYDREGNPAIQHGFGLAVPKEEIAEGRVGWPLWMAAHTEAYQVFPSRNIPPGFAWKYKDGDSVDHNGEKFSDRPGHAGHLVFALTSQIAVKYYRYDNGAYVQVNDGIKCGDYVQVQVQVKAHPAVGQGKPGLYLNPQSVLFLREGVEIVNAPTPEQTFGGAAPSIPAWMASAPTGTPPPATMPGLPAQGAPQGFAPPQAAPPANYGVVPPAHQPQGFAPPQTLPNPSPGGFPGIPVPR